MGQSKAGSPIKRGDYMEKALYNLDDTRRLPYGLLTEWCELLRVWIYT
jgi:hypothetical protein